MIASLNGQTGELRNAPSVRTYVIYSLPLPRGGTTPLQDSAIPVLFVLAAARRNSPAIHGIWFSLS